MYVQYVLTYQCILPLTVISLEPILLVRVAWSDSGVALSCVVLPITLCKLPPGMVCAAVGQGRQRIGPVLGHQLPISQGYSLIQWNLA